MREIKFRAWNKTNKIMFVPKVSHDFFRDEESINTIIDEFSKRNVVMQYTGLKDKNGKEIYEGDVVVYNKENLEVYFDEYCYRFSKTKGKDAKESHWMLDDVSSSESEVIGNIYENLELINK